MVGLFLAIAAYLCSRLSLKERNSRINRDKRYCPATILWMSAAERFCQQQIGRHHTIYIYSRGVYEKCYKDGLGIYSEDFQYAGVYARDCPTNVGPWPEYGDAWKVYVKAWAYIYGKEKFQETPEMREAVLDSAFKTGKHTLLWPGWHWMFIKHHLCGYHSRFNGILFPATLDNGEPLPLFLERGMGLVPLKDVLSQIDIKRLPTMSRESEGPTTNTWAALT